jgi:hypothetical protein
MSCEERDPPSAADHDAPWDKDFDVIMTNSYSAGYAELVAINTGRGVSPLT